MISTILPSPNTFEENSYIGINDTSLIGPSKEHSQMLPHNYSFAAPSPVNKGANTTRFANNPNFNFGFTTDMVQNSLDQPKEQDVPLQTVYLNPRIHVASERI